LLLIYELVANLNKKNDTYSIFMHLIGKIDHLIG